MKKYDVVAIVTVLLLTTALSSCGAESKAVPNVVGEDYATALSDLNKAGFASIEAKDEAGRISILGVVSKQNPKAAQEIPVSQKIELTMTTDSTAKKERKQQIDYQTLVGQKWSDANRTLQSKGLTENQDFTIKTDDGKMVIAGSNWTVESVSAGDKPVISLKHDATASNDGSTQEKTTTGGLDQGHAKTACEQRGKQEYPYGFKPHFLTGMGEPMWTNDSVMLQFTATIKNEHNAKRDYTVTCNVRGTNDAPEVFGWLAK